MEMVALVLLIAYAISSAVVYHRRARHSGKSVGVAIGLAIVGFVLFAVLLFGTNWILDASAPDWFYTMVVTLGDVTVFIIVMTAALLVNCAIAAILLRSDPQST